MYANICNIHVYVIYTHICIYIHILYLFYLNVNKILSIIRKQFLNDYRYYFNYSGIIIIIIMISIIN